MVKMMLPVAAGGEGGGEGEGLAEVGGLGVGGEVERGVVLAVMVLRRKVMPRCWRPGWG